MGYRRENTRVVYMFKLVEQFEHVTVALIATACVNWMLVIVAVILCRVLMVEVIRTIFIKNFMPI